MIKEIISKIRKLLPSKLIKLDWNGSSLTLVGNGWSFSTDQPWRLTTNRFVICGSEDDFELAHSEIRKISKLNVIDIDFQSKIIASDLVFCFEKDCYLEVFSSSSVDPWTCNIKESNVVYIGSPSDPACVDPVI